MQTCVRSHVGVGPFERLVSLVVVAQELDDAVAEAKEGEAQIRVLHADSSG